MNKKLSYSIYVNNTYIDCVDIRICFHLLEIYNCFLILVIFIFLTALGEIESLYKLLIYLGGTLK